MTTDEASTRYNIPEKILREYERWGFRENAGARDYDAYDIEKLSMIITLCEIGFAPEEVEQYMRRCLQTIPRKTNGCKCSIRKGTGRLMKFTLRKSN